MCKLAKKLFVNIKNLEYSRCENSQEYKIELLYNIEIKIVVVYNVSNIAS